MLRGLVCACALVFLIGSAASGAPQPSPSPGPTSNPEAEHLFLLAKDAWRARTDVPYLHYGALIRYLHNGHVFDNWWDAYARSSDGQLYLNRLVDEDEDRRRLRGIPFSIFGFQIFDTNRDAEPIRIDQPNISPTSSFGVLIRSFGTPPSPVPSLKPRETPEPEPSGDDFRTIGRVEANTGDYRIELAGTDTLRDGPAIHLTLEPLRTPELNRLRDLWLDPQTHRTMQLNVAGIYNGQPYNEIEWTVHYVLLDGRNYVQQIVADAPLRFGLDTVIPKFEIDLVDYHFPADVPKYTFDKPFGF